MCTLRNKRSHTFVSINPVIGQDSIECMTPLGNIFVAGYELCELFFGDYLCAHADIYLPALKITSSSGQHPSEFCSKYVRESSTVWCW